MAYALTSDRADAVCKALATGKTIAQAAKAAGVNRTSVGLWVNRYGDFAERFAQARQARDLLA